MLLRSILRVSALALLTVFIYGCSSESPAPMSAPESIGVLSLAAQCDPTTLEIIPPVWYVPLSGVLPKDYTLALESGIAGHTTYTITEVSPPYFVIGNLSSSLATHPCGSDQDVFTGAVLGQALENEIIFTITAVSDFDTVSAQGIYFIDEFPPSAPDVTNAKVIGCNVDVDWKASSDYGAGVAIYLLRRNGQVIFSSPTALSYSDPVCGVSSATYTVTAVDGVGNATTGQGVTVNLNSLLSPPSNLRSLDNWRPKLAWNAVSGGCGTMTYEIRRDGELIGSTTQTTYTDNGAQPCTPYTYTVVAVDCFAVPSAPATISLQSGGNCGGGGPKDDVTMP